MALCNHLLVAMIAGVDFLPFAPCPARSSSMNSMRRRSSLHGHLGHLKDGGAGAWVMRLSTDLRQLAGRG
jgi:hypothetical protein